MDESGASVFYSIILPKGIFVHSPVRMKVILPNSSNSHFSNQRLKFDQNFEELPDIKFHSEIWNTRGTIKQISHSPILFASCYRGWL